ncbi:MAG TPA: nickel pincer cofactor biosynthesis protein LarB [Alloacidobacterium sp.]|nr:nickel pincer cofactor biosynthesis protein LarB [Alloacidobacterium sp.]
MTRDAILALLRQVESGTMQSADALEKLSNLPFEDAGFVKIDHHRSLRLGLPEVIYSAGKTPEQVAEIFARMALAGGDVIATRADHATWNTVRQMVPEATYHAAARIIGLRQTSTSPSAGPIAVLCAGTSDIPVAEEAAVTAEYLGTHVHRIYDVGVAGLHRLLAQHAMLREARAVIVCAGMEGALPSVVGGLVAAPVIAVPTSVGYGAAFGGLTALLGMLNSCAPNVAVVNIDNGFGAAYVAAMMLRSVVAAQQVERV